MKVLCRGALWMAIAFTPAAAARAPQADTTVAAVLSAARGYLDHYRADLTFVIADEETTQRITRQVPDQPEAPRSRSTKSEVHFRSVAGAAVWMAIRDVKVIDGTPADPGPDLVLVLQTQEPSAVARAYKARNSKYNLGRLARNFNEPTLALGILDPARAPHITFTSTGARTSRGVTFVTLAFKEQRNGASFVYDLRLRPAPVEGEIVVEAGTGRIHRTVLRMRLESVRAELTTTYETDAKLGILVPVTFREVYEDGVDRPGSIELGGEYQYEHIFCDSKYTNFRRFAATAKIK